MEKTIRRLSLVGLFLGLLLVIPALARGQKAELASGQEAFIDNRCNTCHAVASAEIAAKSEKTAGLDLGGYEVENFEALARFLRKEEEREGEKHSKTYKGSDEELQLIVDWLAGLEPVADPAS